LASVCFDQFAGRIDSETQSLLVVFVSEHPHFDSGVYCMKNLRGLWWVRRIGKSGTDIQKNEMSDFDVHRQIDRHMKIGSLSGLLVALVALGIIFIGLRELSYPALCARQFGVPLLDQRDGDFLAIKAARDVASGIVALTFLALRNRKFLTCAFGVLTLIPIFDGLIVLRHAGWTFAPTLLIHWGTAVVMLATVVLLSRGK
jgi:Domain of unknown function (DUF4267)